MSFDKIRSFILLAVGLFTIPVPAQIRIESINRAREIAWSGAGQGDSLCLQWSPSLSGPWDSAFAGLPLLLDSGSARATVPAIDGPVFYRISRAANAPVADVVNVSKTLGLNPKVLPFEPAPGDGRPRGVGVVFSTGTGFEAFGSVWQFDFSGQDPLSGVQVIHPYKDGHCIIAIRANAVGLYSPERWISVGYGNPNLGELQRHPDYEKVFPLQTTGTYRIRTGVTPTGAVSIQINDFLVATGTLKKVNSLDFTITEFEDFHGNSSWDKRPFRGPGFPFRWLKGFAGLIVEPIDTGAGLSSGVSFVTYAPGF